MQIVVDLIGLADQVGDMRIRMLKKSTNHFELFFERFTKLFVLLVSPRRGQRVQLVVEPAKSIAKVGIELFQVLRELTEFFGIDDGLWHSDIRLDESCCRVCNAAQFGHNIAYKRLCSALMSVMRIGPVPGAIGQRLLYADHVSPRQPKVRYDLARRYSRDLTQIC